MRINCYFGGGRNHGVTGISSGEGAVGVNQTIAQSRGEIQFVCGEVVWDSETKLTTSGFREVLEAGQPRKFETSIRFGFGFNPIKKLGSLNFPRK